MAFATISFLGLAGASGPSVARDANGTTIELFPSNSTQDYTGLTIGVRSNLALVVHYDMPNGAAAPNSVIWDAGGTAQALTLIQSVTASDGRSSHMFGLVNPVTGNKILRTTNAGSTAWITHAISYYNVDQTGGTTTFRNAGSATGTSTTPSLVITSAAGDMTTSTTGVTNADLATCNQTIVGHFSGTGSWDGCMAEAVGAATVTHTYTVSPSNAWGIVGCSIKKA